MRVKFRGQLTDEHLKQAYRLNSEVWIRRELLLGAVLLIVIGLNSLPGGDPASQSWMLILIGILLNRTFSRFRHKRQAIRETMEGPLGQGEISGTFNESGVGSAGTGFASKETWTSFSHYQLNDNMLLLYQNRWLFNTIPRTFFASADDWFTLTNHVQQLSVPKRIRPEPLLDRAMVLLLVAMLVLSIATLLRILS